MVYVYFAEGFEEIEALTVVDVLRRADCEVKTVSITDSRLVMGRSGIKVETDIFFDEADHSSCEMIVLPGGLPGATNLELHEGLTEQIKSFETSGKKIAAICAGPRILGAHGVLEGRRATIFPGSEKYLVGAKPTHENVTVDGNIITGKGPALAMEFALKLVEELKGKQKAEEVAGGLLFD